MSRRQKPFNIDLEAILLAPVKVRIANNVLRMETFEAQFVQCADMALRGDVKACIKFIRWCLRAGLIKPIESYDDHQQIVTIPKDWDYSDFMVMYDQHGPPPWRGLRDGLTAEDRERRAGPARKRRGQDDD